MSRKLRLDPDEKPPQDMACLVTVLKTVFGVMHYAIVPIVKPAIYNCEADAFNVEGGWAYETVTAWMPMPSPYRKEEDYDLRTLDDLPRSPRG